MFHIGLFSLFGSHADQSLITRQTQTNSAKHHSCFILTNWRIDYPLIAIKPSLSCLKGYLWSSLPLTRIATCLMRRQTAPLISSSGSLISQGLRSITHGILLIRLVRAPLWLVLFYCAPINYYIGYKPRGNFRAICPQSGSNINLSPYQSSPDVCQL